MRQAGFPDNPFARAAVGDEEFLARYATRCQLADLLDENGFNLLCYCAASGLGRRDSAAGRRPAFLCASSGGNEEVMRLLLEYGGLAAERSHQVVEHALEPHQRSGEPFYHIAELIARHGFDVNDLAGRDRTLLHGAANRGTIRAVRWLLQHGANPNARDTGGRTPLHVCAERNTSAAVARLLIDGGTEPAAKDPSGKTPLDYARENQRHKVADYLASLRGQ
jgi:ankyrin repeat protein